MQFRFFDPAKPTAVTHSLLPHWAQEGATYFITWRTADSLPEERWQHWQRTRSGWLEDHGIDPSAMDWRKHLEELPEDQRKDFRRLAKIPSKALSSCRITSTSWWEHYRGNRWSPNYLMEEVVGHPNQPLAGPQGPTLAG